LDESIAGVTLNAREYGYRLIDLLNMLIMFKSRVWQAVARSFPTDLALSYLQALTIILDGALAYTARVFNEEVESGLTSVLQQTQSRLSQLDNTKRNFISIAAHELKTPLTLIQGYSNILTTEILDPNNERARSIAAGLVAGTRRLEHIINDMIAVSMIGTKTLSLYQQLVSLNSLLQNAVEDLRAQMHDRKVTITLHAVPEEIKPFYADPQRLYDAFSHVIGNGVKYTPDGGRVDVRTTLIMHRHGGEPVIEVKVSDNGIGIAPERRELIFELFYGTLDVRTHSSGRTKFKGGGPGLGLVITKGIIEAHGGKIWAESPGYDEQKRPGSTFYILLPMRTKPLKSE
jgi:signal transduction histidine kinase